MKKIKILVLFVLCLSLSNCGLMISGAQKRIAIIDAPRDLEIKDLRTGKNLPITIDQIGTQSTSRNTATIYYGPAIKMKLRKVNKLELKSNGITKVVEIRKRNRYGLLLFETVMTFGVFTTIDLATGGNETPNPKYIDVQNVLDDKPQRTKKEIQKYIRGY